MGPHLEPWLSGSKLTEHPVEFKRLDNGVSQALAKSESCLHGVPERVVSRGDKLEPLLAGGKVTEH